MAQALFFKILVQQAWLNTCIVLVFSAYVPVIFPFYSVIIDLADFYIGINSYRLDTENFQRPVARKSNVAKAGSDMDKKP